jgi:NADPH:quinone reductase-like Zn-dependent oxidoreductase
VLEVAGGNAQRSVNALARGGQIALIGFLESEKMTVEIVPFMLKFASLRSVGVGHRQAFEALNRALEAKRIRPILDTVYPFREAREAFNHLLRGPFGKVVIEIQ